MISLFDLLLLSVALAMDCFTVSIMSGVILRRRLCAAILRMALLFGIFQALMPLLGWAGTAHFSQYLEAVDHWIAFGLLVLIGGKMIKDGLSDGDEEQHFNPSSIWMILTLAIATSIDALAIGISFACLSYNNFSTIAYPVVVIGFVSLLFSLMGLFLGVTFGKRIEKMLKPELAGGIILILIGIKILIEHLELL